MKVFILLCVIAIAFANQCDENEHFESCGTACPLTCDNYDNPPRFCVLRCDIGCHCDKGYVRNSEGRCVKPEECPARFNAIEKTCLGKPDPGMCAAYMPMWYYDVQAGECYRFIYGGCQGNGNRYATREECMNHCQDVRTKQAGSDTCDLPAETGVCRGFFPRYYFDRTTGQCESFIYGGCGGNENNFESEEECRTACAPPAASVCLQEKSVGPCRGRFIRYYFNQKSGKCEEFVYGGCFGNTNNFNTLKECEAICLA